MDNKTLIKIIIATVALIIGFIFGSLWQENKQLKNNLANTAADNSLNDGLSDVINPTMSISELLPKMPAVTEEDHLRGNPEAKIVLVEYSDYECSFCNLFHPTMQQVITKYGDQVAWVYRHFPLINMHAQAQISAEASECVAKLAGNDIFWKYSDRLFEEAEKNGSLALTENKLIEYASELGVNNTALQNCLDSGETTELVNEDAIGGESAGITGTPGTILVTSEGDYELISGALPLEQVISVIEQYL